MTGQPGTSKCWVHYLRGDAKKFMDALEEAEDETPESVFRKGAADEFREEFGVDTTAGNIGRHLNRDCGCRPRT